MPLCNVCEALDIDADSRLGAYTELVAKAAAGCEACKFYCEILQNSTRWSHQVEKLQDKVVFLYSRRLDARSKNTSRQTYSCDDLLLDYVFHEDYTGQSYCLNMLLSSC